MQKSIRWPTGILISFDNFELKREMCPNRLFCPVFFINAQNRRGFTEEDLSESGWQRPNEGKMLPEAV